MKVALVFALCFVVPALGRHVPYIIGGEGAVPGEFPWQCALEYLGEHECGCSIISENYVLTAAHCTKYSDERRCAVVVGLHDIFTKTMGKPQIHSVEEIIIHPRYSEGRLVGEGYYPNDISLLRLSTPINMTNEYVSTIALAEPTDGDFAGAANCTITGWGVDRVWGRGGSNILQKADVDVYNNTVCSEMYRDGWDHDVIWANHVCAGVTDVKGACGGDSGGPLACKVEGEWKMVGASSWNMRGCDPRWPSVYTRISNYREWIQENVGV